MNAFIDTLLPRTCLGCKTEGFFLCARCRESVNTYRYFVCPICKQRVVEGKLRGECRKESGLTRFIGAPLPYSHELVKKTIHAFKYQHAKQIADTLSEILCWFWDENNLGERIARYKKRVLLVPVPLSDFRARERGFNQAKEIADRVGERYGIPVEARALTKRKHTRPQADVPDKDARAKNIAGAFLCKNPQLVRGKIIILLDDVYTTGATMRECATVLRQANLPAGQAGAREVWGATIARG